MKSYLWLLIMIPIFLVGIGLLMMKNNVSQIPKTTETENVTVLIKADAFDPETLEIKKGSVVSFKNMDSQLRWPASDIHPTHGLFPEFDPKEPLKPGQSWQFRFNKTGSWKYHDHLVPSIRGLIVVKD